MLETKYFRDYRHNYLIIKDNGCLLQNTYQRKMITENQIKGLLSSQERNINGEVLLYYEITSKQSLFSIYDGKCIYMSQIRELFMQLKLVNDMLLNYLLDGSCLLLLPEYIFQDLETKEFYFLYYPDPEEGGFEKLIDFLIARVNSEDMKAIEIVYKIADLFHQDRFVLDEILKWFQEEEENVYNISENPTWEDQEKNEIIYTNQTKETVEQETEEERLNWFDRTVSAFLEKIKRKKVSGKREEVYQYAQTSEDIIYEQKLDAGNTVFIPWAESCENKLYSMNKKNKCHIDLEKLPLTVGKLAGAVDMVINENSISRMHVKFSRNGNKIFITDLNSTNGTFRNGIRLSPNASEIIEPGDEIRLGKLKFVYR
ncbi:MAG: DUF6382 domain-containing protein [Lachnospiraceae bacterium]|nr:DUF6382 domain-containing protein [Lachnospiraceae bacterium]